MYTKCCGWLVLAFGLTIEIVAAEPLFQNSVVSNDLEFIRSDDPSVFACFSYLGERTQEMPGHSSDELIANGVFSYRLDFTDGVSVQAWVHYDVVSEDAARDLVRLLGLQFGRIPTILRKEVRHVVIHAGDGSAFAEDRGGFFVLYADNMAARIANHDLEETLFHESVHVALDLDHAAAPLWRDAQRADGEFITQYAERLPEREDLAESALFAYAMIKYEGRLPSTIEQSVKTLIPNRLAYIEPLFSGPTFTRVGPEPDC